MPTETKWTRDICQEIKGLNGLVFAIVASERQEPGWPDRFICHRRWNGHIEFKGRKTPIGGKQKLILRRLRERGANACITRYPDRIETPDGELIARFDGTGRGLLKTLRDLDPLKNLLDCLREHYEELPEEVQASLDSLGTREGL